MNAKPSNKPSNKPIVSTSQFESSCTLSLDKSTASGCGWARSVAGWARSVASWASSVAGWAHSVAGWARSVAGKNGKMRTWEK